MSFQKNQSQQLFGLIRKFKKSKSQKSFRETEIKIITSATTLDDLITVLTLCPVGSVPFMYAKNNLLDTIPQRSLAALVYIYENLPSGNLNEIKTLALESILSAPNINQVWITVMEAIAHPCHELSDKVFNTLMERPQDRLTIFKLHRLTAEGSENRMYLEKYLILPYIEEMSESDLIDITMVSAPKSFLMQEVQKILDRMMVA